MSEFGARARDPDAEASPGAKLPAGDALLAYRVNSRAYPPPVPSARWRAWANASSHRFANRCLPLLMANQAGWVIGSPSDVEVIWRGGTRMEDLEVTSETEEDGCSASSHFGHGLVTWCIPYLFRTPPGYNLLVRGPANAPKDAIAPLEGLVETDWAIAPFTMNWQVTRPNIPISFKQGEPICMVVPQRRGELKAFGPTLVRPRRRRRRAPLAGLEGKPARLPDQLRAGTASEPWQKHYFRGTTRPAYVSTPPDDPPSAADREQFSRAQTAADGRWEQLTAGSGQRAVGADEGGGGSPAGKEPPGRSRLWQPADLAALARAFRIAGEAQAAARRGRPDRRKPVRHRGSVPGPRRPLPDKSAPG